MLKTEFDAAKPVFTIAAQYEARAA
jgi:hypothetical protein